LISDTRIDHLEDAYRWPALGRHEHLRERIQKENRAL
jgi:hypothetical protein